MGLFKWFSELFSEEEESSADTGIQHEMRSAEPMHEEHLVNPATGLPMQGGTGGLDILGNPFGVDLDDGDTTTPGL